MEYLIDSGASVDFHGPEGQTPLHTVARVHRPATVKSASLLLHAGADPSIQGIGGGTPLHYAAQHGRYETVELLLDAGADPFVRNSVDMFTWDLAFQAGFHGIVGIFEALVR